MERFIASLERSSQAQALARTALLLTMMLLISRSSPLPDKRYQLYQKCIENLLTAIPERRAEEGVQSFNEQWRPDDSDKRLQVLAHLAYTIQEKGYTKGDKQQVIESTWK